MSRRAVQIKTNASRIGKKAANTIVETAVRNTPADTGRARSNWRAKLDARPEGSIPPHLPGQNLGISETGNASVAIGLARAIIQGFDVRKNGQIVISNGVINPRDLFPYIGLLNQGSSKQQPEMFPYIGLLNQGSSKQQPEMFVERAVQAGVVSILGEQLLR
jgi:hypothetical protein